MGATIVNPLGWTLIHSLWQCAAIALLCAALNRTLRRAAANTRYLVSYLLLLAMPIASAITFASLSARHPVVSMTHMPAGAISLAAAPLASTSAASRQPLPYLAIIVWLWLSGVIAMSVWSAAGWAGAQRLKRRSKRALPEVWQQRLSTLAEQLRIRRTIGLYETALAQVPAVIGWIRPVILVPAGALLNLSAAELEALIAHELAHVRRHDYLANLLQSAIEVVMFYHPAVWWISKRIRAEREHCCDDLAIAACGNRMTYARALTALEELRGAPQFAMAATSGSLVSRIRRLLGKDEPQRRSLPVWIALVTLSMALLSVWSGPRLRAQPRASNPQPKPAPAAAAPLREGYLAGLVDAGYTEISVDEIIELKNNGISPAFIKGILQAGLGTPTPRQLIALKNNGVNSEYARAAAAAHIADMNFERLGHLKHNDVNLEAVGQIHAQGFGPFTTEQVIDLQHNGALHPGLFAALKESGYAKVDTRQIVEAQRSGLSPDALRSLREQRFTNLTLEQVIKLKRAGVI